MILCTFYYELGQQSCLAQWCIFDWEEIYIIHFCYVYVINL